jgi:hypothetical protein
MGTQAASTAFVRDCRGIGRVVGSFTSEEELDLEFCRIGCMLFHLRVRNCIGKRLVAGVPQRKAERLWLASGSAGRS